jgi:ADP-ribosylglycohydrolase
MEMSKGGVFKLYEGQFTDDSEMAFHLLRGLATLIPTQALASQYSRILLRVAK